MDFDYHKSRRGRTVQLTSVRRARIIYMIIDGKDADTMSEIIIYNNTSIVVCYIIWSSEEVAARPEGTNPAGLRGARASPWGGS